MACCSYYCGLRWRFWYAVVGFFTGLTVFAFFGFFMPPANWITAGFGLFSTGMALIWLVLVELLMRQFKRESEHDHHHHHSPSEYDLLARKEEKGDIQGDENERENGRPRHLDRDAIVNQPRLLLLLIVIGTLVIVAMIALTIYFLVIAGIKKEGPTPQSDWVNAVWTFMSFKWTMGYTWTSFQHYRHVRKYM